MPTSMSTAATDLGLGSDAMNNQIDEEEKKRRLRLQQMNNRNGPTGVNAMGLAASQLLGNIGA